MVFIQNKYFKSAISLVKNNQTLQASLVLFLALVIFFSPAIFAGRINSASGILQIWPTFNLGQFHAPHNQLLSDPMVSFEPWFKFDIDSLKSGHFPLWNPFQGNGTPHLANMQSAFFYPLTWLPILLGLKWGLMLLYFFKLFFIGFFTYLFLKEIKIDHKAAIIGAVAFMFAGYNVVWLYWPHTNVIFFLPLSLLLIEKILKSKGIKYAMFYSIALAIALFGGHPETFAHVFLVAVLYLFYRILVIKGDLRKKALIALHFALGAFIGVLLASIQLIPFFEYLFNSSAYYLRTWPNPHFMPREFLPLNLVPDLFGNQSFGWDHYFLNIFNYNETTSGYVGLAMTFFALLSLSYLFRKKIVIFFSLLALLSVAIVYKAPIIFYLFTLLPVFDKTANHRMLFVLAFSIVVIGSIMLSELFKKKLDISAKKCFLIWLVYSIVIFSACAYSVKFFQLNLPDQANYKMFLRELIPIYLFDLLLILLLLTQIKRPKVFFMFLLALIFGEVGVHGLIYEPAINRDLFFPETKIISFLKSNAGDSRIVSISDESAYFGPDLGTYYGIRDIRNYDAMLVKSYKETLDKYSEKQTNWQGIQKINPSYLNIAGVKYVIAASELELKQKLSLSDQEMPNYPLAMPQPGYAIYENKNVLSRAFLVDPERINSEMFSASDLISDSGENKVEVNNPSNNKVVVNVKNDREAYLILTDTFYPGWSAYVDGSKKEIIETKNAFRAVYLEKGDHEVTFAYEPKSFLAGLFLSVISLLIILAVLLKDKLLKTHNV